MLESPKNDWPQLILFDLDGTLIDSAPDIAAATNELLKHHGFEPLTLNDVRSMIGNGVKKLVERAFKKSGIELVDSSLSSRTDEMMEIYAANLTKLTTEMAGAEVLLRQLKAENRKTAVVTNKPEKFSREIIGHFCWETLLDAVVGGDTCVTRKPDPEMLFHACEQAGLEPTEAIMVGDSPADIKSAQNADIRSIAVRGGYTNIPVEDLGADVIVNSLSEVYDAINTLNGKQNHAA